MTRLNRVYFLPSQVAEFILIHTPTTVVCPVLFKLIPSSLFFRSPTKRAEELPPENILQDKRTVLSECLENLRLLLSITWALESAP